MQLDIELYRHEVPIVTGSPPRPLRLSAFDISPEHPARAFVFLHGFGGNARQWRHQLQHFSDTNRVIALDMRGHGFSDQPADGST